MNNFFFDSLWPGLVAWSLLYISDYALTIICARLYRRSANKIIVFGGSYELNSLFQKDIDALRSVSPRFIAMLILSNVVLASIWFLFAWPERNLYPFFLGAFILVELMVHTRHLQNFFLFKAMAQPGLVLGRIEYSHLHSLRMSANQLFVFAGLYLFLCAFIPSWFLLGGVFSCLVTALKHRQLARKAQLAKALAAQTSDLQG